MRYASIMMVLSLALAGCSSIADAPLIGVPANAPARPQTPAPYLPVHDMPPPRQDDVLSVADQTRIEKELSQARDKGKSTAAADAAAIAAANPPPPAPKKQAAAKKRPANAPKPAGPPAQSN